MEQWKEVLGYDVLYEVSNLGRVRTRYNRYKGYTNSYYYLEPCDNGHGYLRFNWKLNGIQKTVYLHRLVALAFLDNKNNYEDVNHKDENKMNNCVENLEWVTHKDNCNYGTRNIRSGSKTAIKIRCVETGEVFNSVKEASIKYQVGITAISNCLNGRSKSCCGYVWEYVL